MKTIFVVWLKYPNEPLRYSVAFSNCVAAEKYAARDKNAIVTEERVFDSVEEI